MQLLGPVALRRGAALAPQLRAEQHAEVLRLLISLHAHPAMQGAFERHWS